jgi:RNA polymerase sigma factor (sigma-70 family)
MAAIAYIQKEADPPPTAMLRHLDTNYTEAALLQGCKDGSRLMQEKFYQKFHGKMLAVCLRYTKDREVALDIMNRGFLRVFNKINSYQATGSLEGWIRVIIVHAVADYFREKAQPPVVYPEQLPEDKEVMLPQDARMTREILQQALYQLPESQRLVFNLFAVEGYAHKEIAGLLKMNENTVRWNYAEAKKRLQQLLTHSL